MKRLHALLRTTWWLWLIFFGSAIVLTKWVDPIFVVCFPMYIFTFFYFAIVRYDENGERRGPTE